MFEIIKFIFVSSFIHKKKTIRNFFNVGPHIKRDICGTKLVIKMEYEIKTSLPKRRAPIAILF